MSEAPQRILIVEDEAIVALDIQRQLESLGYDVVDAVSTSETATERAEALRPDLVLMDIRLKGGSDGIDAADAIRRHFDIPVVFLTAYVDAATLDRAKAAEPYGYLVKPFEERELNTAIQVALSKSRADRAVRSYRDDLLAILNAQRHGTVMIDEHGRITLMSSAAERLLGAKSSSACGKPWQSVFKTGDEQRASLEAVLRAPEGERSKITAHLGRPEKDARAVEIDVRDDPRNPERRVLFLYDVSQLDELRRMLDERAQFASLVGQSKPMEQVFQLIREVAEVDCPILIEGETGTGKELVARAIHLRSHRHDQPFVPLNCAGLGEELAASQLFGHNRGSFTGAVADHAGLFEAASGGTLFLDEISELPLRVQTMLLRVLEEGCVRRVGSTDVQSVDVRILAASNRDLAGEVENGRFRSDLLYRIRVARITLPPLCQRREDLPLLARHFLHEHAARLGKNVHDFADEAMAVLLAHDWPGNVRELKNAVEFAVIRAKREHIRTVDLPPEILDTEEAPELAEDFPPDERSRVLNALDRAGGNRKKAARLLGISRATLYRRLAQYGIEEPSN